MSEAAPVRMKLLLITLSAAMLAMVFGCGRTEHLDDSVSADNDQRKVVKIAESDSAEAGANVLDEEENSGARILDNAPQLPPANFRAGTPRMPKARDLMDVAVPEVDEAMQRFVTRFAEVRPGSNEYNTNLKLSWQKAYVHSFLKEIPDLNGMEIDGTLLPRSVENLLGQERFEKDRLPFLELKTEIHAGRVLTWIATLDCMSGGHQLSNLLQERANELPPTQGDLVILYAAVQGIREFNSDTNRPILEDWDQLSQGKNPIYRLIALKASIASTPRKWAHISSEDPRYGEVTNSEKLRFLNSYMNEKDPIILLEAIRAVRSHPSKEAIAMLERLRSDPEITKNKKAYESVEEALEALKAAQSR